MFATSPITGRIAGLVGGGACLAAAAAFIVPSAASAASTTSTPPSASAGTTSTTTTAAPSATDLACDRGPWGLRVEGAPKDFDGGDRGGDYLWHDSSGFHLRVTHKNDNRVVYTGQIISPTPLRIDPVKLEKGDVAELSPDHRTLTFAFADYGHIDGVNFHTDCAARVTVTGLNAGNDRLPPNRVYLGRDERHPQQVPFTIHRRDQ